MRPVVLLHGFLGFDRLWGMDYFKGVPALIRRRHPRARILTPAVDPDASIQDRARALARFLNREVPREEKVHLVAHSMGGLDARCYISSSLNGHRRVASLTTLGTPHWGTPAAEWLAKIFSGKRTRAYASFFSRLRASPALIGKTTAALIDRLSPFDGGLPQMTPSAMARFNRRYPNRPGVAYFSVAGVVRQQRRLSPLLIPFYQRIRLDPHPLAGGDNDGLVSVLSARGAGLGVNDFRFLGAVNADHFNLIGHDWRPTTRLKRWWLGRPPGRLLAIYDTILGRIERL